MTDTDADTETLTPITPHLVIDGAGKALDFYKRAFGAREIMRMKGEGGRVEHAQIEIGGGTVMLADEYPELGYLGPKSRGGSSITLYVRVADVDAFVKKAVAAGATLTRPVEDQFYGDRTGTLEDPFGHLWHIATRKETLTPEELNRRHEAMMKKGG